MSEQRTELGQLGEFGLIDHLTKKFKNNLPTTIKGVGDDAAVIFISEEESLLVSTDFLLEGVHFNLMYMPLKHLGYKAVAVNVSDICAMNGVAEQITVSIAVSSRFPVEALEELYEGIQLACEQYNIDLIGGDTASSLTGLMISVTAVGRAKTNEITYRTGAKEHDLLVVTGDLGGAYMGLQVLEREKEVFKASPSIQPDLDGHDYIIERQLKPEARKDIIGFLKTLEVVPTSMIDISDGLASEILHITRQSKKGCKLYEEKFPIDPMTAETAREFGLDPTVCALNGGEDYELLFTIKQADYDRMKHDVDVSIIGYITEENAGNQLITKAGNVHDIKAQGWNAFKSI